MWLSDKSAASFSNGNNISNKSLFAHSAAITNAVVPTLYLGSFYPTLTPAYTSNARTDLTLLRSVATIKAVKLVGEWQCYSDSIKNFILWILSDDAACIIALQPSLSRVLIFYIEILFNLEGF